MNEQPKECERFWTKDETHPKKGYWSPECQHIKEVSNKFDMEGETYECSKCGYRYRLYYDDMK